MNQKQNNFNSNNHNTLGNNEISDNDLLNSNLIKNYDCQNDQSIYNSQNKESNQFIKKEEKRKIVKACIYIIGGIILILLIITLVITKLGRVDNNNLQEDNIDKSNNNNIDYNSKKLYIFEKDNYYLVKSSKKESDGYVFVTEYICSSSNCNPHVGSKALAVIIEEDNKYVLFDVDNEKKIDTHIMVDENYALVTVAANVETKEIYGLIATSMDSYGEKNENVNSKYYSIKYNKVIENEDGILGVFKGKYMITYSMNGDREGCVSTLIDIATEKTLSDKTLTNQYYQDTDNYLLLRNAYHLDRDPIMDIEFKVLDENLKFVSNKYYTNVFKQNNSIYLYNNTVSNNSKGYDTYNASAKKLTHMNLNFDILDIINGKVIAKGRNNYLTVLDMNGKMLKEISEVDLSKIEYNFFTSGYFEADDDKKEGIYLKFKDSERCFEYFFDDDTYETVRYNLEECSF